MIPTTGSPQSDDQRLLHSEASQHSDLRERDEVSMTGPSPESNKTCPEGHRSLTSAGLWMASVYSTAMSCLFLVIAIVQPRYGYAISNKGRLSPSSATLLTAFFAKTIELSFGVVFLSFLGQSLSRRAMRRPGCNLASIVMRSWILQPGTLFTQWRSVKVVGFSTLGLLSTTAAILLLLYTTAAGALVQPQLRFPPEQNKVLVGGVLSDFSNVIYAQRQCITPIRTDKEFGNSTCGQLKWSSSCGSNFNKYMELWNDVANNPALPRPPISATLQNNITVTTGLLNSYTGLKVSKVNNFTVAVPHRGVVDAARLERNGIIQPEDLGNTGAYTINAQVPAFGLNALCVSASRMELAPIVYETWPNAVHPNNSLDVNWPNVLNGALADNQTILDDIFGWNDGTSINSPPIFYKFPMPANTIANHTSWGWGRSMVYVLGQMPLRDDGVYTEDYFLCSMSSSITTACSTRYTVLPSGRTLDAVCDAKSGDSSQSPPAGFQIPNWRDIGFDLLNAMSLNTGMVDGSSSYARVLTQLQLLSPELSPVLPSPAEALVSIATCTALDLVTDFPFTPFWNHTQPSLDEIEYQSFNASVRIMQYMSGGETSYQQGFIVVLALTFIVNAFIFLYYSFVLKMRLLVDIFEPLRLFLLAYNSPSSDAFPSSHQSDYRSQDYGTSWVTQRNEDGSWVALKIKSTSDFELGRVHTSNGQLTSRVKRRVQESL